MARIRTPENTYASLPDDAFSLGGICLNGHDYNSTGKSLRYVRNNGELGNCVTCSRERKRILSEKKKQERLASLPPEGFKKCPVCCTVKGLSEFKIVNKGGYGCSSYCRICANEYSVKHRMKKPIEERRSINKKARIRNWMTHLLTGTRSSAKVRGLTNTLTIEDVKTLWEKQQGKCYWLGLQLGDYSLPNRHPLKPSLDRLDCSKGYEVGNVVFTCNFANMGRSNTPFGDFSKFIEFLKTNIASQYDRKLADAYTQFS